MKNTLHINALRRAARIRGGNEKLASHLGVPLPRLLLWLSGKVVLPDAVFQTVIDIVVEADLATLSSAHPGESRRQAPQRVLVVDDHAGDAYTLGHTLAQLGLPVATATDAQSAIEIALRQRPDVVFLDLRMPEIDGYELVQRLKAEGIEARFIAATAYGSEEDRERTARAGFEAHLLKPIDGDVLRKVLSLR